jgi:hypothetical protein
MSDLVERLKRFAADSEKHGVVIGLVDEAAGRIERLQAENATLKAALGNAIERAEQAEARIEYRDKVSSRLRLNRNDTP